MAGADPYASYLQRAEELFASGDVVQAGQIWQAILKREPAHAEAREGLLRVKAHLEALTALPPLPSPPQPPAGPTLPQDDPEIARLLDQGCTLYDSGHVEDALRKWEKILARNPDHAMARGYINGARKRLGQPPLPQFAPPPPPPPPGDAEVRATIVQPLPAPCFIIAGPRIHILAEQRNLAGAAIDQRMSFSDNICPRPRDFRAARIRHNAVGAKFVAAFLHR